MRAQPGRPPARERHGLQIEHGAIEPEVAQDRLRALLQVGATEREPRLERVGVAVARAESVGRQVLRGGLHACLGHAGENRDGPTRPYADHAPIRLPGTRCSLRSRRDGSPDRGRMPVKLAPPPARDRFVKLLAIKSPIELMS